MGNYDILFVDDEPKALQAFARQLGRRFSVRTAASAAEALTILQEGPCPVIVSDMKMPGMDGIQLLSRVKELYPDTVRIMFTGNADLATAIEAVNDGQIFRFLTKPVNPQTLTTSLKLAIGQYRLITAEKELLNQTLKNSVKVLCELLSLANPTAFSCGYRIKKAVVKIAEKLHQDRLWQFEIAALMSMIGCIAVPYDILRKIRAGTDLTEKERVMYRNHPRIGAKLIGRIPRLSHVAAMIENQMLAWDDYGEEPGMLLSAEEQTGAQILRAAIDHDHLLFRGIGHPEALRTLEHRPGMYNPKILKILAEDEIVTERVRIEILNFEDIIPGMIADEDILAKNGALIIPRGQEITWPVIQGLTNYLEHIGIRDPIRVRVPEKENTDLTIDE
ncbi:MAG: Response regulator receiver protein [uncultured bacterium]|nr:MAG: Response regulator receiver protein [uncultured bacterium]